MIDFPNEESKWCYVAAFIESDGYLGLIKNKRSKNKRGFHWRPCISFAQKDKICIKQLHQICGWGKVHYYQTDKYPRYQLSISSNGIRIVLPKVIPYLLKKKEQAVLLLEACSLLSEHQARQIPHDKRLEEIYWRLRKLHGHKIMTKKS